MKNCAAYGSLYVDRGEGFGLAKKQINSFKTAKHRIVALFFDVLGAKEDEELGDYYVKKIRQYAEKELDFLSSRDIHIAFSIETDELIQERAVKPVDFLELGEDYYESYKSLKAQNPQPVALLPVKYYLLCHSLELGIKSLLRAYGLRLSEIKNYGHDLLSAVKDLQDKESSLYFSSREHQIITLINDYYRRKSFEYYQDSLQLLPPIEPLAQLVKLKLKGARKTITGSATRRRFTEEKVIIWEHDLNGKL